MGFLRRLLGGPAPDVQPLEPETAGGTAGTGSLAEEEAAREGALLREDASRLDDELLQRQLRYADRSWTPPRQGGERRAGEEAGVEDGRGDGEP